MRIMLKRRTFALATAALAAAALTPLAHAFGTQQQPIRLIVPFAPGGPLDITSRALAESVRNTLGTVIIENRAGAGGNIGVEAIAKSHADGLTIGLATTANHAINPWLYGHLNYNAEKDFAPITQMVRVPNVLVINAKRAEQLGINSVSDLIAYAKANPGKLTGNSSTSIAACRCFYSHSLNLNKESEFLQRHLAMESAAKPRDTRHLETRK